jgi:hypothetical protein
MKPKNALMTILTYSMILLLTTMTNIACVSPERKKSSNFFVDFDVLKKEGIVKLSGNEVASRMQRRLRVYQLIYNSSGLDSVIIFNPYKGCDPMKLSLTCNNSVSVYETDYLYWEGVCKSYFVVKPFVLEQYVKVVDGWDVRTIKKDTSFGRLKVVSKDDDTIGFKRQLLNNEPIRLRNMPAHGLHIYNNRLRDHFTFTNWLRYGVFK